MYVPDHFHGMNMVGMQTSGGYGFAAMFSSPDVFFNVNGNEVSRNDATPDDSVHLMALVWDPETRTVLPEAGLSVDVDTGDEGGTEEVIYPMLSQRMGFHWGGNFALPGFGTYDVEVSVGGLEVARTGDMAGRFEDGASTTFQVDYSRQAMEGIGTQVPDNAGEPGAVSSMDMMAPDAVQPSTDSMPGSVVATGSHRDAELTVSRVPAGSRFAEDRPYLGLTATTPYNRMTLPMMGVDATLSSGGETVFEGSLTRTIDHAFGYHYGAPVDSLSSGDTLTLDFLAPPQTARHLGYEKAFVDMTSTELSVE